MYLIKRIFIFLALPVLSWSGDLTSLKTCLSNRYQKLSNRNAIAVAVLDPKSSEIMTFGYATENQIFEIGSITKTFTSQLLALDVIHQKIKLTDPIPKVYQKPDSVITYQHLTSHSSGIIEGLFPDFKVTNELFPYEGLSIPIFKELYTRTPLKNAPGEAWNYSNIGSSLLGLILSENAHLSYEARIQKEILEPLRMKDTYFQVPSEKRNRFPKGYLIAADGTRRSMPYWDLHSTAINPAGGIRSTIGDMVLYARAHLVPESSALKDSVLLTHQNLFTIKEPNLLIGMNWILQPDKSLIWHNGQTYGFNSILAVSTKKGQAIVALTDTTVQKKSASGEDTFDTALQDAVFECLNE